MSDEVGVALSWGEVQSPQPFRFRSIWFRVQAGSVRESNYLTQERAQVQVKSYTLVMIEPTEEG